MYPIFKRMVSAKKIFFMVCQAVVLLPTCFAMESWHYTANVTAQSKGESKTVFAKIDGKKTENNIHLRISKADSGTVSIESDSFKLGKMPFSSSFSFTIPSDQYIQAEKDKIIFKRIAGKYTVLGLGSDAYISGWLSKTACEFVLSVERKNKNLVIRFSYYEL